MKASDNASSPAPKKPSVPGGKPMVIGKSAVPLPKAPVPKAAPRAGGTPISDNPADVLKKFDHLETPAQIIAAMSGGPIPPARTVGGSARPSVTLQARPVPAPHVEEAGPINRGGREKAPTIHKHVEEELDGYGRVIITDTGGKTHTLLARMRLAIRMRDAAAARLTGTQSFKTVEFEKEGYDGPWFACAPSSVTFEVEPEEASDEQPQF